MPTLPPPPSDVTGPLGAYLEILWHTLQGLPNASYFSGATPNGVVLGVPGDLAMNIGSASTDSRLWVHGGGLRQPSTTGWVVLRTLA